MTTTGYTTKKAIFDKLAEYAAPGQPLEGVDIGYAWSDDFGLQSIYGGGIRFDHADAVAEHPGVLVQEIVTVSLYIRVMMSPPVPVEETDARAAEIGALIGAIFRAFPHLEGGSSWLGITGGAGDYEQTPDSTVSVLAYQIRAAKNITYGGG